MPQLDFADSEIEAAGGIIGRRIRRARGDGREQERAGEADRARWRRLQDIAPSETVYQQSRRLQSGSTIDSSVRPRGVCLGSRGLPARSGLSECDAASACRNSTLNETPCCHFCSDPSCFSLNSRRLRAPESMRTGRLGRAMSAPRGQRRILPG
jgi:hypothetical protein